MTTTTYDLRRIADALGIKYMAMYQRYNRGYLPNPDGVAGRSPFWFPATIEPWIEQQKADDATSD